MNDENVPPCPVCDLKQFVIAQTSSALPSEDDLSVHLLQKHNVLSSHKILAKTVLDMANSSKETLSDVEEIAQDFLRVLKNAKSLNELNDENSYLRRKLLETGTLCKDTASSLLKCANDVSNAGTVVFSTEEPICFSSSLDQSEFSCKEQVQAQLTGSSPQAEVAASIFQNQILTSNQNMEPLAVGKKLQILTDEPIETAENDKATRTNTASAKKAPERIVVDQGQDQEKPPMVAKSCKRKFSEVEKEKHSMVLEKVCKEAKPSEENSVSLLVKEVPKEKINSENSTQEVNIAANDMVKDGTDMLKDRKDMLKDKKDMVKEKKDMLKDKQDMVKEKKEVLKDKQDVLEDKHNSAVDTQEKECLNEISTMRTNALENTSETNADITDKEIIKVSKNENENSESDLKEAESVTKPSPKEELKTETEEISHIKEGGNFTPFRLKSDMRMAPLVRNDPDLAKERIDSLGSPSGPSGLYLEILKTGRYQPKNGQSRTWPLEAKDVHEIDDDIEIMKDDEEESEVDEDEEAKKVIEEKPFDKTKRAKLLQFHENHRPAYWGTWTKKHEKIKGRTPFARDDVLFDYDYDSDNDWEDEQGESLSDDEEKDKEEGEYEVDYEFVFPDGYLSSDEKDREDEAFNSDTAKEKLKLKQEEFAAERKNKNKIRKPYIWGCHWEEEEVDTSAAAAQLIKILTPYNCIIIGNKKDEAIKTSFTKRGRGWSDVSFPEEAMEDLIKLIHANPNRRDFLTKEFIEFWKKTRGGDVNATTNLDGAVGTSATPVGLPISGRCIVRKIIEVADYEKMKELGDKSGRFWVVKPEILEKYKVTPTLPNNWKYILEPPMKN